MIQKTREQPPLMAQEEMKDRLAKGERPLPLSVEKYERVVAALESGQAVSEELISGETCPLCEAYVDHDLGRWCQTVEDEYCPLYVRQGCHSCDNDNTAWHQLITLVPIGVAFKLSYLPSTPETIAAAKVMLAVLKELCDAES